MRFRGGGTRRPCVVCVACVGVAASCVEAERGECGGVGVSGPAMVLLRPRPMPTGETTRGGGGEGRPGEETEVGVGVGDADLGFLGTEPAMISFFSLFS